MNLKLLGTSVKKQQKKKKKKKKKKKNPIKCRNKKK